MNKKSIACIAFNEKKVFIAHRNPVGKVEDGETDEQSIIREFEEEFGVKVSVDKKIAEATFKHNGDDFSLHAYLIHLPHDGMTEKFALTEHTEYRWAELAEIPTLNFVDSDLLIYPQICKFLADSL